jgi:AraC-like DNA-binding protein
MSLIALSTRDSALGGRLRTALGSCRHDLVCARAWNTTCRIVKERPVGVLMVDLALLGVESTGALVALRRAFPSLPVVVLSHPGQARLLFDLGRRPVGPLNVAQVGDRPATLAREVAQASENTVPVLVTRALGSVVPSRELGVLMRALDLTHRCWTADVLARSFGYSRPVLSERLKSVGLPSVGHLMVWARMMHAGHWLPDGGRSGESVSRQLEYANGSVFRRALRNYVGLTPTTLARRGGLKLVLGAFAHRHAEALTEPRVWVA